MGSQPLQTLTPELSALHRVRERQRRTGGGNVWKSANVFGSSAGGVDCFSFFRKFFFLSFFFDLNRERKKEEKKR